MTLRVEKKDGGPERRIVTALIVSTEVLSRISAKYEPGLFSSPWGNLIAKWAVDHFERYRKAPGKDITALFEAWAEDNSDTATVEAVDKFLTSLSGQYAKLRKEVNADLILDQAGELFNRTKTRKAIEAAEGHLENGDVTKAMESLDKFRPVEMGPGGWVDPLRDDAAIRKAFESKREPLIAYPGGLGEFFGDALERDGFIAFQAPDKSYKSQWLLDIAWTAMLQGRKVALFQVGDMSQDQVMRRLLTRAAKRPFKAVPKFRGGVKYPTRLDVGDNGCVLAFDTRYYPEPLDYDTAKRACEKVVGKVGEDCLLRLSVHANYSVSMKGIRAQLERWSKEGFDCDACVVDYADLIAPTVASMDKRDQVNMTWGLLRQMSQELHCLVVTATQSNAAAYEAKAQSRSNFSEDKRKNAHVTGMVGLSHDADEKREGVQRLNWIQLRDDFFDEARFCYVANCIPLARPAVLSHF